VLERDGLQTPIEVVGPAVIAALELIGVALLGCDDHCATMRTLIVDDLKLSLGVAHDDDRLAPDFRAEIVADVLNLAFVADVDPCGAEDPPKFKLENLRIGVEAAMNARGLHELRDRMNRMPLHRGRLALSKET
jgi:hypothetical protein